MFNKIFRNDQGFNPAEEVKVEMPSISLGEAPVETITMPTVKLVNEYFKQTKKARRLSTSGRNKLSLMNTETYDVLVLNDEQEQQLAAVVIKWLAKKEADLFEGALS